MGTAVFFHAHPDDEAIATGGSMARAHAEGHRVVLVVATGGEHGEVPDDLAPDESLADRRRVETERSGEALGVDRIVWLGYADSGMTGWAQNDDEISFFRAELDEAGERLAAVLREEHADVLTIYDWHGNYGHPDHVQVYRVGCRAAELVASDLPDLRVFEATMNRDEMRRQMAAAREAGETFGPGDDENEFDPDGGMDDGNPMGTPEAELTMVVDVHAFVDRKRDAIRAHRSQVTDSSFFLQMPPEAFAFAFGREWFTEHGRPAGAAAGLALRPLRSSRGRVGRRIRSVVFDGSADDANRSTTMGGIMVPAMTMHASSGSAPVRRLRRHMLVLLAGALACTACGFGGDDVRRHHDAAGVGDELAVRDRQRDHSAGHDLRADSHAGNRPRRPCRGARCRPPRPPPSRCPSRPSRSHSRS